MSIKDLNVTLEDASGSVAWMIESVDPADIQATGGIRRYVYAYVDGYIGAIQDHLEAESGRIYAASTIKRELRERGEYAGAIAQLTRLIGEKS